MLENQSLTCVEKNVAAEPCDELAEKEEKREKEKKRLSVMKQVNQAADGNTREATAKFRNSNNAHRNMPAALFPRTLRSGMIMRCIVAML